MYESKAREIAGQMLIALSDTGEWHDSCYTLDPFPDWVACVRMNDAVRVCLDMSGTVYRCYIGDVTCVCVTPLDAYRLTLANVRGKVEYLSEILSSIPEIDDVGTA